MPAMAQDLPSCGTMQDVMAEEDLRSAYESRVRSLESAIAARNTWLEVLAKVAERIHPEREEHRILEIGLEAILSHLQLRSGWIFLGEEKEKKLRLAAWRGVSQRYLDDVRERGLDECLCPEVFWSGHRMLARNTTQCPRMPHIVEGLSAPVAHACIPLRFEGESRGVLNVAARPGELFSDDELAFLETVGRQLCLAIERAKHLRAESARLQEARALAAINRAIGTSLEIGEVLEAVGETALELISAERVMVLLGSDPERVRVAHISGAPHPELRAGQELDLVAHGARLLRKVIEECGTHVVEDWQTDERVNKVLARRWDLGSAVVACLSVKDRTLGALMLSRASASRWPPEAVELAEALAAQAAVAIEKAHLYEELRRAYQELKDAQARMIQSEKMAAVGTFASGLAHEVRNPLNSVALQLSLLERRTASLEPELTSEIKELIGIIREEVKRLDGLVSDFLELSRAGRLQRRPTDLDAVIDEVVRLLRPEARARGITLRRKPLGEPAPELSLDGEKVKQVLINLVRNSIEAMPDGGAVTLESGAASGWATIHVRDTGPGLPEGLDVFQLFVTSKPQGTGLGLSIAQQIVLEHGGELVGSSQPGRGAVFTVRLPLPQAAPRRERRT
jgi:signal transduction histidine kinase